MKNFNKKIVWLLMIGILYSPIQSVDNQRKQYTATITLDLEDQSSKSASYFEKFGNYLQSESCMSHVVGFSTQVAAIFVGAYIYMYVHQHTKDTIGNQTMKIYYPGDITLKLKDVAGLSGAKAEMQNIISYLENPKKYQAVGAKISKGVLLNGTPGNGKTLLAKAVAGEVNVPFISVAGASFVQMYVGLGAARIRDLFALAQQLADQYGGCIIFIDEIDAIARKRSASDNGAGLEHDQTVAQLLECMDGIQKDDNSIVVLGASNRAELLDSAVVRQGRFDSKVEVTKPYKEDRIALIKIALENVKHAKNLDIDSLSRITAGFSGAELTGLINDAAVLAVNDGRKFVETRDLELAFDHITLGREIKGMDQSLADQWITSVHEAGHAVGWLYGNNPKYIVHKASIIPRSKTLGVVWATLLHESYSQTREEMKARIVVSLCGGLAEQEFGYDKSTGMSNDLAKAYALAYEMVIKYGMSDSLNYISYDGIYEPLPNDISSPVYQEAKKIVDECLVIAKKLIASHKAEIEKIAKLLMQRGTVLGHEIYALLGLPLPRLEHKTAQ